MDDVINFKIYLRSSSKAMADREKKREEGNTKIWISRDQKELFWWNTKPFSYLFKGYHLVKNEAYFLQYVMFICSLENWILIILWSVVVVTWNLNNKSSRNFCEKLLPKDIKVQIWDDFDFFINQLFQLIFI